MIVHAQLFEIKQRTEVASYTLPYHQNPNLDYEFIKKKCEKVTRDMVEFDNDLHQMDSRETKTLFYFFRYVKKNLFLMAAIDLLPGLYES